MQFTRPAAVFVVLAVAGSLGLAACGSDDSSPAKTGDPTTTTTSTTEATTTTDG